MSHSALGFSLITWILVNLCTSLFMTGVIWFVQIVHYPLFAKAGREQFAQYESEHAARTGYLVGPVMVAELGAAMVLTYGTWYLPEAWMAQAALALVALVWLSTFLLQVPRHNQLHQGFTTEAHCRLVRSNWLRTVAWTCRSALLIIFLLRNIY